MQAIQFLLKQNFSEPFQFKSGDVYICRSFSPHLSRVPDIPLLHQKHFTTIRETCKQRRANVCIYCYASQQSFQTLWQSDPLSDTNTCNAHYSLVTTCFVIIFHFQSNNRRIQPNSCRHFRPLVKIFQKWQKNKLSFVLI